MDLYARHLADQAKVALNEATPEALRKFDEITSDWFQTAPSSEDQLQLEQELGYDSSTGKWLINGEWVNVWDHL